VVALSSRATSSRLSTTGSLRGCARRTSLRARSGRSTVCVKKKRSADTMLFIVGTPTREFPAIGRNPALVVHLLRMAAPEIFAREKLACQAHRYADRFGRLVGSSRPAGTAALPPSGIGWLCLQRQSRRTAALIPIVRL